MKITPDVLRYEFIGTEAKVSKSKHPGYIGISGKIIDETRNTFTILHEGKCKKIVKDSSIFNFRFSNGTIVEIEGKLLVGRPEDRLKKHVRRLW
ncbi:MAG: ribonuclease P protein component 1 [Candidatus Bathyarchaeia archaeon]